MCYIVDVLIRASGQTVLILLEFGEILNAKPALVTKGFARIYVPPLLNFKPVCIRRSLLILNDIHKKRIPNTHMIKNPVPNDPHTASMHFANQMKREGIGACPMPCGRVVGFFGGY